MSVVSAATALEALMQTGGGKLPINVKVIFEGEEEVGGESIAAYIRKEKTKLKADFALVRVSIPDTRLNCFEHRKFLQAMCRRVVSVTRELSVWGSQSQSEAACRLGRLR